MFYITFQTESR